MRTRRFKPSGDRKEWRHKCYAYYPLPKKSSLLLQAYSTFLTECLENKGASMLKRAANKALTLCCNALQQSV